MRNYLFMSTLRNLPAVFLDVRDLLGRLAVYLEGPVGVDGVVVVRGVVLWRIAALPTHLLSCYLYISDTVRVSTTHNESS